MFQKIPVMLGQYRPLDTYIHRLDARAKIILVCLILILSMLTSSVFFYLSIFILLISGLFLSGIKAEVIWKNLKPLFLLIAITSLYHLIFITGESEVLINIFGWKITQKAFDSAVFFSLRMVIFITAAFIITLTSSPSELGEAFYKLVRPFEKLRLPVSELTLILFIALRFIPILYEEFISIKNAQIIRGVNFGGSFVNRIKKTGSIIIPLFIAATQKADDLALAMQARGYDGGKNRSFYSKTEFGLTEILFVFLTTVIIGGLFYYL